MVLTGTAAADPFDPFQPSHPSVLGRGGSFVATAEGYNTFFHNPAGFASAGELTLASANAWAFTNRETLELVEMALNGELSMPGGEEPAPSVAGIGPRADPEDPASENPMAGLIDEELLAEFEEDLAAIGEWFEATDEDTLIAIMDDVAAEYGASLDDLDPGNPDLMALVDQVAQGDIIGLLETLEDAAAANGAALPVSVDDLKATLADALPSGYADVGAMVGLGFTGRGLGLGVFANVAGVVDAANLLQASATAVNTITFVGGLGLSLGSWDVGFAIRPIVLGYSTLNVGPLLSGAMMGGGEPDLAALLDNTVYFGSGLAIDAGAVYNLGPFRFGMSAKDLFGTSINYASASVGEYAEALMEFALPVGAELTADEQDSALSIPMKVNVGAEFHPDLGPLSFLIDPRIGADIVDLFGFLRAAQADEEFTAADAVDMLHIGGEAQLLRFLSLRGGYYGGALSGGVGLKLLFLDVNAAVSGDFAQTETGEWGFTDVGAAVEAAIRF